MFHMNRLSVHHSQARKLALSVAVIVSSLSFGGETTKNDSSKSSNGRKDDKDTAVIVATSSANSTVTHPLAALSPTPPIRIFRPNPYLEIAFDVRTRNPLYVMEKLDCKEIDARQPSKRPNFHEEKSLPEEYRSRLHHYKYSGFDRGHLAPAADFGNVGGGKTFDDTFTLCNVSPQNHAMNVSTWARLEHWCRAVAKREDDTYVVTGPLWLPSQKTGDKQYRFGHLALGNPPSLVQVPTHFFKVVVVVRNMTIHKYACFVLPNTKPQSKSEQLEDFLVHWNDLEAVSGLQFFPMLTSAEEGWKDRLIPITNHVLAQRVGGKSSAPLLITDGGGKGGGKQSSYWKQRMATPILHLCANGSCRS